MSLNLQKLERDLSFKEEELKNMRKYAEEAAKTVEPLRQRILELEISIREKDKGFEKLGELIEDHKLEAQKEREKWEREKAAEIKQIELLFKREKEEWELKIKSLNKEIVHTQNNSNLATDTRL